MGIEVESYALTDQGKVRANNEDFFLHLPKHLLFTVADGMGGHIAGEVAAKEATHHFLNSFIQYISDVKQISKDKIPVFLTKAMDLSNEHLFQLSSNHPKYKGMGTTFSCLYLHENLGHFAHIGDSRIYHYRRGQLKQLTQDHTSVKTHITPLLPTANINTITRAIGVSAKIKPDIRAVDLEKDDIFLICSDGLHGFVSNEDLERIIGAKSNKVDELCESLINQAKINTSNDNITLIAVKIHKLS